MNDRIKEIRKCINLNQADFGAKIGVRQGTIACYENGSRTPLDPIIMSICREFNVNETWLRTGEGEMFRQIDGGDELKRIFEELSVSEDQTMKRLIRAYWRLSESEKAGFRQMLDNMVEEYEADSPAPERTEVDIAAELAELKRQNAEIQRQNQELSARLMAMEEEDELFWHPDTGNLA